METSGLLKLKALKNGESEKLKEVAARLCTSPLSEEERMTNFREVTEIQKDCITSVRLLRRFCKAWSEHQHSFGYHARCIMRKMDESYELSLSYYNRILSRVTDYLNEERDQIYRRVKSSRTSQKDASTEGLGKAEKSEDAFGLLLRETTVALDYMRSQKDASFKPLSAAKEFQYCKPSVLDKTNSNFSATDSSHDNALHEKSNILLGSDEEPLGANDSDFLKFSRELFLGSKASRGIWFSTPMELKDVPKKNISSVEIVNTERVRDSKSSSAGHSGIYSEIGRPPLTAFPATSTVGTRLGKIKLSSQHWAALPPKKVSRRARDILAKRLSEADSTRRNVGLAVLEAFPNRFPGDWQAWAQHYNSREHQHRATSKTAAVDRKSPTFSTLLKREVRRLNSVISQVISAIEIIVHFENLTIPSKISKTLISSWLEEIESIDTPIPSSLNVKNLKQALSRGGIVVQQQQNITTNWDLVEVKPFASVHKVRIWDKNLDKAVVIERRDASFAVPEELITAQSVKLNSLKSQAAEHGGAEAPSGGAAQTGHSSILRNGTLKLPHVSVLYFENSIALILFHELAPSSEEAQKDSDTRTMRSRYPSAKDSQMESADAPSENPKSASSSIAESTSKKARVKSRSLPYEDVHDINKLKRLPGVSYDVTNAAWRGCWPLQASKKARHKSFAVHKYGFMEARNLAIKYATTGEVDFNDAQKIARAAELRKERTELRETP